MLTWVLIPSDARLWQLTCKYLFVFLLFTVTETILYRHSDDIWHQAKRFCSFSREVRKECSSNTRIVDTEYRLLESRDPGTTTYLLYLPKKTPVHRRVWRNRTSAKRKKRFNEFNHPTPFRW